MLSDRIDFSRGIILGIFLWILLIKNVYGTMHLHDSNSVNKLNTYQLLWRISKLSTYKMQSVSSFSSFNISSAPTTHTVPLQSKLMEVRISIKLMALKIMLNQCQSYEHTVKKTKKDRVKTILGGTTRQTIIRQKSCSTLLSCSNSVIGGQVGI